MICFPNAKINLGLHVTSRRPDGYHNLETIFIPNSLARRVGDHSPQFIRFREHRFSTWHAGELLLTTWS